MKQDNPFAKLGALEQKLYQETSPKPEGKDAEKASTGKSQHAGIPASQH